MNGTTTGGSLHLYLYECEADKLPGNENIFADKHKARSLGTGVETLQLLPFEHDVP